MLPGRIPLALVFLFVLHAGTPIAHAAPTCPANNMIDTPTADFTVNGNGTITHDQTGLMWKQCAEGLGGSSCNAGGVISSATLMNWDAALSAAAQTFAGYSDWRLPNRKELHSIVETGCHSPSINETVFPNTPSALSFWTSTNRVMVASPSAWLVLFTTGISLSDNKTKSYYVRLVRGGQPMDSFDTKRKGQVIVFGTAPTLVVSGTGTVSAIGSASLNPVIFSSLNTGICTISGDTASQVLPPEPAPLPPIRPATSNTTQQPR